MGDYWYISIALFGESECNLLNIYQPFNVI